MEDEEFETIIPQPRNEELTRKEKLKTKWAALEALVGNDTADLPATFLPPAWRLQ